ncbi:MAG TPA: C25 family cysteine peptidase, partial [Candidatus Hydrogenedentes bacterium]|nr:C25 family cysteine peptidase [Candidatus Hydrogenedentota bacterium]
MSMVRSTHREWILVVVFIAASWAVGASEWRATAAPPGGDAIEHVTAVFEDGLTVAFSLNAVRITDESKDGQPFTRLDLPGAGVSGELGRPELPAWRRLVEVPKNAVDVRLDVIEERVEALVTPKAAAAPPVYPVQPPRVKLPHAKPAPLAWDRAVYAEPKGMRPAPVELSYFGVQRGRTLYEVTVHPVEYVPAANALTARTRVVFDVRWDCAGAAPQWREDRYRAPILDTEIDSILLNPAVSDTKAFIAFPAGYLIIANPTLAANALLQDFANTKRNRGFDVTLVSTSVTGTTTAAIKNYIQTAYDT